MTSKVTVKEAIPNNAQALAEVWNRLYPERPKTLERFDFNAHRYLLALANDTPLAYLKVSRSQREGDPEGKYWAYGTLAPSDEDTVMRALYERLEALHGVRVVYTMTHESQTLRQQVLERLGYYERLRSYGADLDTTSLDLSTLENPEAPLNRQGITLHTLADLLSDVNHVAKLYALYLESHRDVPAVGHLDTMSCQDFTAYLNQDDALPEAYNIAVHGGLYVGYSELFRHPVSATRLRQETTAVLPTYRRRGIALALKRRGLAYAKRHGYTRISTGMASNNAAMVALNTRLGFVPQEAYVTFSKNVR